MAPPLQNYLRTYRKRSGLSQREVAFLLGAQSGSRISRYECFQRTPDLETAIALRVLFQKPTQDLFAGVYRRIEDLVLERTSRLLDELRHPRLDAQTIRKVEHLELIADITSR